jgi:hypothetical protein
MRHLIAVSLFVICAAALAHGAGAQGAGGQPLTNHDIVRLLKQDKVTAEQVKERLKGGAFNFDLSEAGLKQLQDEGVDASVVAAMIQAPRFKGDWHVADLYEYLDAIQLSGTNYVPSLFSPLAPGVVYVVLLALAWLAISSLSVEKNSTTTGAGRPILSRLVDDPRLRAKVLAALIIAVLLGSGVVLGRAGLLSYSYSSVEVPAVGVGFLAKTINPGQSPCAQALRRRAVSSETSTVGAGGSAEPSRASPGGSVITEPPRLTSLMKGGSVRESEASSQPASPLTQPTGGGQVCTQPATSPTPNVGPTPYVVGKVISAEGDTGDVNLEKRGDGYVLNLSKVNRAGKYAGRVSADVVAPLSLPVTLNVSDWWPYFFVAVTLGVLFSNYSFRPRPAPSLPHDAAPEARTETASNREVAEAFTQGVNSSPVTTLSSLAALLAGLYASYNGVWGLPKDYVTAFLGGAAITLGLRTLAGAANAASARLERALKKEPTQIVNEIHLPPPRRE